MCDHQCANLSRNLSPAQVVEEIFGDSIHREVVGRSAKLLRFLSSMEDSLTTEHIDLIWKSCVGKAEPELQVRGRLVAVVSPQTNS